MFRFVKINHIFGWLFSSQIRCLNGKHVPSTLKSIDNGHIFQKENSMINF